MKRPYRIPVPKPPQVFVETECRAGIWGGYVQSWPSGAYYWEPFTPPETLTVWVDEDTPLDTLYAWAEKKFPEKFSANRV